MFQDVLISLRAAAEFAPANVSLRLTLAQTLIEANLLLDAETEYQNIIEIAPYSTEAKCGLARVCTLLDKNDIALLILQEVCQEKETTAEFHILFSRLLLRQNKKAEARSQYYKGTFKDVSVTEAELEKQFR